MLDYFSHTHVYSAGASLPCTMPIRTIDPVCPKAILPEMATLFPSGVLYVTNGRSKNRNNTSFCLELNGKDASETLMSLRFIVLRYRFFNFG